jgi:hypothetical protein
VWCREVVAAGSALRVAKEGTKADSTRPIRAESDFGVRTSPAPSFFVSLFFSWLAFSQGGGWDLSSFFLLSSLLSQEEKCRVAQKK